MRHRSVEKVRRNECGAKVTSTGVIDTGGTTWIDDLRLCSSSVSGCSSGIMNALADNIQRLFEQGSSSTEPSVSNLDTTVPYGS
jgi:hypothetical protein